MTEAEWLACTDPKKMLRLLRSRGRLGPRKARLFACACVRRIHHLLVEERSRLAVEVAEQFAEGKAGSAARQAAEVAAREALEGQGGNQGLAAVAAILSVGRRCSPSRVLDYAGWAVRHTYPEQEGSTAEKREQAEQARLLRECFANPFQEPPVLGAALASGVVARLALAAEEERRLPDGQLDPLRLAILADALEEAGCDSADVLEHLRQPGEHVRGCWVVDRVLGKE